MLHMEQEGSLCAKIETRAYEKNFFVRWSKSLEKDPTARQRNRIHCTIKKRFKISPFELIDNRFARIHGRSVYGEGGAEETHLGLSL